MTRRRPYDTLPCRSHITERAAYLDTEEANRRDARNAGEFTSPPASHSDGTTTRNGAQP